MIFITIFQKKKKLKNIWEKRRENFNDIVIKSDNNINENFFLNFRSHKKKFIAENPSLEINNFFKEKLYSHHIKYNKYLYKKLIKNNPEQKKLMSSFKLDNVGNPGYCVVDGNKTNERFLRHCHFFNLLKKNVPIKNIRYVTDIGGGYGSFARMIHTKFKKVKIILIDLPEQLLLAKYYLSCNFPKSRVSNFEEIYKSNIIDKKILDKYEIILVPNTEYEKINLDFKKNIIINLNSFGEIDANSFNDYLKSKIVTKSKYLFSVNRLDSFPTYDNNTTFLDYKFERYKKIHSAISPVWDIYFIKKFYLFTKKKYFSSRILEFIGKK